MPRRRTSLRVPGGPVKGRWAGGAGVAHGQLVHAVKFFAAIDQLGGGGVLARLKVILVGLHGNHAKSAFSHAMQRKHARDHARSIAPGRLFANGLIASLHLCLFFNDS